MRLVKLTIIVFSFLTLLIGSSCSSVREETLSFPESLHQYQSRKPIKHAGYYDPLTQSGKWLNYLIVDVPYSPVEKLRIQIEQIMKIDLSRTKEKRGMEAHLTVLTPVEYWSLHSHLKMQTINSLFLNKVQSIKFEPICIGRGISSNDSTYFLVVHSEDALNIRRKIHQEFIKLGGDKKVFNPESYFPHITIGFNNRDLHYSDGVIKDESSCYIKFNNLEKK